MSPTCSTRSSAAVAAPVVAAYATGSGVLTAYSLRGTLVEVTQVYVQELGPEVERYVPPALNALRPLLDTLPQPVLTDADVDEKLTLD